MRLRAQVSDVGLLTGLAQTAVNVSPCCYLQFTPGTFRFICPSGRDGTQIWATPLLFSEYRVQSNRDDEITVEVATEALSRVLRSASGALEIVLRLGKRHGDPLLSMAIVMSGQSGARVDVTQDILIRILRTSELSCIKEPMCPTPDVYIVFPPLTEVRAISEQMRSLSDQISLAANQLGTLRLAVLDNEVVGEVTWTELEKPKVNGPSANSSTTSSEFQQVHLSMRALQNVLSSAPLAKSTIACICADQCIVFYVYLSNQQDRTSNTNTPGILNFIVAGADFN